MTPFDTLWADDLLDQVGFGPGDRVLDLAGVAGGGGGSTLPFGDASFDVVVCHHGLQLLPDRGGRSPRWSLRRHLHRQLPRVLAGTDPATP